jgi:putative Mg2+ transporter-C (MgtC) family protein
MLVAVGCALFTQLSIYGFTWNTSVVGVNNVDPSRLAAQVVTGMGFIGAGAILKYGASIRGLTTAASLWATAAIGIAVGTGLFTIALAATAIALLSLWPLDRISHWLRDRGSATFRATVVVDDIDSIGVVANALRTARIEVDSLVTRRHHETGSIEIDLELQLPRGMRQDELLRLLVGNPNVKVLQADRSVE